jgi:hypothetical protein
MAKKSGAKVKAAPTVEHWGQAPEEHDYPAAARYLNLLLGPAEVKQLVAGLKAAPLEHHQAKDLLRASGLALLAVDNAHVAADLAKVKRGSKLSPVLLVRGDARHGTAMLIADGYHRVCASYHLDENAQIPCHLAELATPRPRTRTTTRTRSSRGPTAVQ